MSTPFLGEIRIMSFNSPPRGWAFCNGQLLPINQNQALFSLLGTTYGGNGQTNFALPNLQGRVPLHVGNGFVQGQTSGEENHTLTVQEIPAHNHVPAGNSAADNVGSPVGNTWGLNATSGFSNSLASIAAMNATMIGSTGGNQAHNNMSPFLTLNMCIALQGIFPSRN